MSFRQFYDQVVAPNAHPAPNATLVVLKGQDGYRCRLPLEDLLAEDVLLADRLDGQPLTMEHGAPMRVIAPAHYAYKSVKHLHEIEFWTDASHYRFPGPGFMEHPRARILYRERGKYFPAWFYGLIYPPLIGMTTWLFRRGAARFHRGQTSPGPQA